MEINTNFIAGKMNKSVDERLLPPGQYVDAQNVRLGSTETTEIGAVENSKGNTQVSTLLYNGVALSTFAKCIGAYADGINQTMYWFVCDPGRDVDMIVSFNSSTNATKYLVISETVLNFQTEKLITGVNLVSDLLFFTDNFNPPRVVNINREYPYPTLGVDGITEEDISVIVKPPGFTEYTNNLVLPPVTEFSLPAPTINLINTPSEEENYILDKFLCFAYRYKYKDNQYSATSLFTTPAFEPSDWTLDYDTLENTGMENKFNTAEVTFSTGGSNVIGVDLLYKESGQNTIYIIERYDKINEGWGDNTERSITFSKKKIYTLLGQDELLRTFDNVPKTAQAQTVMGNRVFYGNYTDGHNMIGFDDLPVVPLFTPEIVQINDRFLELQQPVRVTTTQLWSIQAGTPFQTTLGKVQFFPNITIAGNTIFSGSATIPTGTTFTWEISLRTTGTNSVPGTLVGFPATDEYKSSNGNSPLNISFEFRTTRDYNSINTMLLSAEFSDAVGVTNFQPISNSNNGNTLTDLFNTAIIAPGPTNSGVVSGAGPFPQTTHSLTGITSSTANEGFELTVSGDTFDLKVPAVKYQATDPSTNVVSEYYEYFQYIIQSMTGVLDSSPNRLSLHSNRDYSLGIIYMDEYGRSSTVITTEDNTVHVNTLGAGLINRLRVSIDSPPPKWATRYKFAIKPSATTYETIYITVFTEDKNDPTLYWFRLVGQDQSILSVGDRLIVKSEIISGVASVFPEVVTLTVLEIEAKGRGEIDGTVSNPGDSLPGLYFSAKPDGWNPNDQTFVINPGTRSAVMKQVFCGTNPRDDQQIAYPLFFGSPSSNVVIQPGSVIQIDMKITRGAYGGIWTGDPDNVKSVDWRWKEEYISNALYSNFKDWFDGQGIFNYVQGTSDTGEKSLTGHYVNTLATNISQCDIPGSDTCYSYAIQFLEPTSGELSLVLSSGVPRGGPGFDKRPARMSVKIVIVTNNNVVTLETTPQPADPNIYYEGSQNFNIGYDAVSNENIHFGNVQNQNLTTNVAAINDLTFANCYSFGNGVESYKIFDNAAENAMAIGERANGVTAEPYQESKRKASITYSGIYNGETNLNNSNEFNLSLGNFKDLELIFGPIMKLHSRETDLLVLQEDRISYILQGKNLLSDAAGGGAITSIPEVLGKQITRLEEFGISFNPESFASWGKNVFFTDTKRNAVIKLSGGTYEEQLTVISDSGMRSFFRDSFTAQIDTQKLGGYDPYMGEYVLNNNEISVKGSDAPVACGTLISQTNAPEVFEFDVNVGAVYGNFYLDYLLNSGSIKITLTWNGTNKVQITSGSATNPLVSGTLTDTANNFVTAGVQVGDGIINTGSSIVPPPKTTITGLGNPDELLLANPAFTFAVGDTYIIERVVNPVVVDRIVDNTAPSGFLILNKLSLYPTTINVKVERAPNTTGVLGYEITPQCVTTVTGSLTQIVLTSPQQSGKQLHYEYGWFDGNFSSPIESNLAVALASPLQGVSAFNQLEGQQSVGMISYDGADQLIRSVKKSGDNIDFNPVGNFLYIFSQGNPMYAPGSTGTAFDFDVTKLNGKSPLTSTLTNPQPGVFEAKRFNVTQGLSQPNMIVVTDLRERSYVKMGYDANSSTAACNVSLNCTQVVTGQRRSSAFAACSDPNSSLTIPRYHNGIQGQNLTVGDIMYQNTPCSPGPSNWTPAGFYKIDQGGPNKRVAEIGVDGLVLSITNC